MMMSLQTQPGLPEGCALSENYICFQIQVWFTFEMQVWYVWFTTNWLQILFLLTLVLLLVSSCVTFQVTTCSSPKFEANSRQSSYCASSQMEQI